MNEISRNKVLIMIQNSMFTAISLALSLIIKIPIIPSVPFLKLDISDIPIFIATLMSGITSGVTVLFCVSLIRTLLFSTAGWAGFIIRMTSVVIIFMLGKFCRNKNRNIFYTVFIALIAVILCVFLKTAISYILWMLFFNMSKEYLNGIIFTAVIPFNIIKSVLNCGVSLYIFRKLKNTLEKI